jgi:hypothetical protein
MANRKISEMLDGSPAIDGDFAVVARAGDNYRLPLSALSALRYFIVEQVVTAAMFSGGSSVFIPVPAAVDTVPAGETWFLRSFSTDITTGFTDAGVTIIAFELSFGGKLIGYPDVSDPIESRTYGPTDELAGAVGVPPVWGTQAIDDTQITAKDTDDYDIDAIPVAGSMTLRFLFERVKHSDVPSYS